ncbi:MAG: glycosyltransferase [Clostridia bacterium]|nr:glycosyltransferase [Clostridia bacterium]
MDVQRCCVLIPSLEPDQKLPDYVKELRTAGFGLILVIDDGSSASYQHFFDEIDGWEGCKVLHHEVNRGKGAALRTGFAYILNETELEGVITADSDGQHTVPDTLRLAAQLNHEKRELLLGSRDFSRHSTQVPPKSRFGNRLTSGIFALLYGRWLPDTQTGLRAMSREMLNDCLSITGDRFEYEMNQLIYCSGHHIEMTVVPIETVYHNENQGTHFHPIRDSWRIYKLILGNFFKYMSSSLICTLVDHILFTLLGMWLLPKLIPQGTTWLILGMRLAAITLVATWVARLFSASLNYYLNKSFVFQLKQSKGSALRYVVVAVGVMLLSSLLVGGLSALFGLRETDFANTLIKIVIDTILYFVNYRIQKNWVFANDNSKER